MTSRNAVRLAVCALALGSFSRLSHAQAPPFTIRRPPDGATVREKVRVEIPRASIKPGGFVAFYLDDKFHVALAPPDTETSARQPFTFVWDTKGSNIPAGDHPTRAVLFEPAAGAEATAVTEKATSEVK